MNLDEVDVVVALFVNLRLYYCGLTLDGAVKFVGEFCSQLFGCDELSADNCPFEFQLVAIVNVKLIVVQQIYSTRNRATQNPTRFHAILQHLTTLADEQC